MEPPTLYVYDTAELTAHYARSRIGPGLPLGAKPHTHRSQALDALQRWEDDGGTRNG